MRREYELLPEPLCKAGVCHELQKKLREEYLQSLLDAAQAIGFAILAVGTVVYGRGDDLEATRQVSL